jgi:DNA-binding transcriptional MerR regulator/methylmalonyl-CoA mutase cobalamin-binding subunit
MVTRNSGTQAEAEEGRLTIGALSRATGIPVETLRTWERRYNFPLPMRKPSGHRVYPLSAVPRLRRVAEAIARGHRAAEVVPIPETALDTLLNALSPRPVAERIQAEPAVPQDAPGALRELLASIAAFDGVRLRRLLEMQWLAQGPIEFLERTATPLMIEVGRMWQRGDFAIRHEHFASARLGDFLREVRRPFEDTARGPRAAFLTLPDDPHELGLLMASVAFTLEDWRVLYLGPNTPPEQVGSLARDASLGAVAVSISASYDPALAVEQLRALRRAVPRSVPVVVGGAGVPALDLKGLHVFRTLAAVREWAGSHHVTA